MVATLSDDEPMVRVGPDASDDALSRRHTRPVDMSGRPMRAWVLVARAGVGSDGELGAWVAQGVAFARSVPPVG